VGASATVSFDGLLQRIAFVKNADRERPGWNVGDH
jgi:hypothetical protein